MNHASKIILSFINSFYLSLWLSSFSSFSVLNSFRNCFFRLRPGFTWVLFNIPTKNWKWINFVTFWIKYGLDLIDRLRHQNRHRFWMVLCELCVKPCSYVDLENMSCTSILLYVKVEANPVCKHDINFHPNRFLHWQHESINELWLKHYSQLQIFHELSIIVRICSQCRPCEQALWFTLSKTDFLKSLLFFCCFFKQYHYIF